MARGSKASYSSKQKRQAEHIEEGYEKRGTSAKEAKARAWATVNKESGGGKKSGSGRGKKTSNVSSRIGGRTSHSGGAHKGEKSHSSSRSTARAAKRSRATTKRAPAKSRTAKSRSRRK